MSSIIAVSVSLIGLLAAVFTLVIFVELIVSFPAMLTSNSQAYVKQQRKTYTFGSSNNIGREIQYPYQPQPQLQQHQHQQEDEDSERWYDDSTAAWVDEHMYSPDADVAGIALSNTNSSSSSTRESRKSGSVSAKTTATPRRREMTMEPMARGRTLRRVSRRHSARTSLRV